MKLTNEGRHGRYMVYRFFGNWQLREEKAGYVPNMVYAMMTGTEGYCFDDKKSAEEYLKKKKLEEPKECLGASFKLVEDDYIE